VQVECQDSSSLNRLKINALECVLGMIRLGQIGLPRLEIWRMRLKIGGMARSPAGGTSCPTLCLSGVDTIEFRSPTIAPY